MIATARSTVTAFDELAGQAEERARVTKSVEHKPTNVEVRAIIEAVFYASLAREEGRPLRVRVGYVAPEGAGHPSRQSWGWWPLPFHMPLPFEKYELVKLAPSVDARQSIIAVTKTENGLRIWA